MYGELIFCVGRSCLQFDKDARDLFLICFPTGSILSTAGLL